MSPKQPPKSAPGSAPGPSTVPGRRDPWLWLAALSVLPLVLHSLGAPLGVPVADDFDFIRHWHLLGRHSLLDGGGSLAFWRPVPHQLYYAALGGLLLDHAWVVPVLHTLLLAASAVLLYRTFRPRWSGARAAVAASFPFLAESVRMVISWPSHGVDLLSFFFSILALHEASRRRLATCLVALSLALLSKEVAVVAALLIPLTPRDPEAARPGAPDDRWRWAVGVGAVTTVWALVYLGVRISAGLHLPHQLESDASTLTATVAERVAWAFANSLRAAISLPAAGTPLDVPVALMALVVVLGATAWLVARRSATVARGVDWGWTAWGFAWFTLACLALTTIYPFWAPNRVMFGSVGLGIALASFLGAAPALFPAALVALRLAALLASPGPSRVVTIAPPETGAFMDFVQLTRLQRLMADTRAALIRHSPRLPAGAVVAQSNMPRGAIYALGGDRAVQVWYRDTTLRWISVESFSADTSLAVAAIVQFQLEHEPQIAMVEPAAVRTLMRAASLVERSQWDEAMAALDRADSLQRDRNAREFLSELGSRRVLALAGRGDLRGAEAEARDALARMPESRGARIALAAVLLERADLEGARRQVDTLVALYPADSVVSRLAGLLGSGGAEKSGPRTR